MKEIWKDIIGFEGIYEVSNYGRVRNVRSGRILSTSKCGGCRGYAGVSLSKDGKRYTRLVHRLVAEAFIPPVEGLSEVNHKDEDKTNNRVENLEWCDHKYNMNYGSRIEKTRATRLKNGTYSGLDNKEYRRRYYKKYYQDHKEYRDKMREAAKKYYQDHKEEMKEYKRAYYYRHREEILEKMKKK